MITHTSQEPADSSITGAQRTVLRREVQRRVTDGVGRRRIDAVVVEVPQDAHLSALGGDDYRRLTYTPYK